MRVPRARGAVVSVAGEGATLRVPGAGGGEGVVSVDSSPPRGTTRDCRLTPPYRGTTTRLSTRAPPRDTTSRSSTRALLAVRSLIVGRLTHPPHLAVRPRDCKELHLYLFATDERSCRRAAASTSSQWTHDLAAPLRSCPLPASRRTQDDLAAEPLPRCRGAALVPHTSSQWMHDLAAPSRSCPLPALRWTQDNLTAAPLPRCRCTRRAALVPRCNDERSRRRTSCSRHEELHSYLFVLDAGDNGQSCCCIAPSM